MPERKRAFPYEVFPKVLSFKLPACTSAYQSNVHKCSQRYEHKDQPLLYLFKSGSLRMYWDYRSYANVHECSGRYRRIILCIFTDRGQWGCTKECYKSSNWSDITSPLWAGQNKQILLAVGLWRLSIPLVLPCFVEGIFPGCLVIIWH